MRRYPLLHLPLFGNQTWTPKMLIWPSVIFMLFVGIAAFYWSSMTLIEIVIYVTFSLFLTRLSWQWRATQIAIPCILAGSFLAILLYDGDLQNQTTFLLSHILSSQSAVMWMGLFFISATTLYGIYTINTGKVWGECAQFCTWIAICMGFIALLVRWHETYLIDPEIGYIPVSNLYEVFILFCLVTALLYLHYEKKIQSKQLGFFAMLIITLAVGFLWWYSLSRDAHVILPLVPALNSYWMKIHVPANFIGYGSFALAAMTSIAWLIRTPTDKNTRSRWINKLPEPNMISDLTYQLIVLGFVSFTLATILGALWAAEAWGSYWSWDPKETWALIVWLNYAAWLHFRLNKRWESRTMAWWAIIGLLITLFAFLGVNMFLSGLHSYGEL